MNQLVMAVAAQLPQAAARHAYPVNRSVEIGIKLASGYVMKHLINMRTGDDANYLAAIVAAVHPNFGERSQEDLKRLFKERIAKMDPNHLPEMPMLVVSEGMVLGATEDQMKQERDLHTMIQSLSGKVSLVTVEGRQVVRDQAQVT